MGKRVTVLMACVCLVCLWTMAVPLALSAETPAIEQPAPRQVSASVAYWTHSDNCDTSWYQGEKEEFVLTTPAQLAGLARMTSQAQHNLNIKLGADMDMSAYKWEPMGRFTGVFDGCGHTISGLRVSSEIPSPPFERGGLFGLLVDADVRNLVLSSTCEVEGEYAGSIAGEATNSSIVNCRSEASVQGFAAGGLVGNAHDVVVAASLFNGSVELLDDEKGDLIGVFEGSAVSIMPGEEGTIEPFKMMVTRKFGDDWKVDILMEYNYRDTPVELLFSGFLLGDQKSIIVDGDQNIGTYNGYNLRLDFRDDFSMTGDVSEDNSAITWSSYGGEFTVAAWSGSEHKGHLLAVEMPFTVTRSTEEILPVDVAPLFGRSTRVATEEVYYRIGCAGSYAREEGIGVASIDEVKVSTLNDLAQYAVTKDPWAIPLCKWVTSERGAMLSDETFEPVNDSWTAEGNYDISWYNETQKSFSLSTPEQLAGLSYLVSRWNTFEGKEITLALDIDLAGHRWVPIGNYGTSFNFKRVFKGSFDGNGHSIRGMQIDIHTYTYQHAYCAGLLGYVQEGVVKNVTIAEDCSIKCWYPQFCSVGGVAGAIKNSSLLNCHNAATIASSSEWGNVYAGGVLGFNDNYDLTCTLSNKGSVLATSQGSVCVGGLTSGNSYVINGYNMGAVRGVGTSDNLEVVGICSGFAHLKNVYNVGTVEAISWETDEALRENVEPLVKTVYGYEGEMYGVEKGYYDITCMGDATGLELTGEAMNADEMKAQAFADLLNENARAFVGADPSIPQLQSWAIEPGKNEGYPVFSGSPLGIMEQEMAAVRVYPTCVTEQLYIEGVEDEVFIYNLTGVTVMTAKAIEGMTVLDLSTMPAGVYIVRIGEYTTRIVKQ